jgi:uncharacterized protein
MEVASDGCGRPSAEGVIGVGLQAGAVPEAAQTEHVPVYPCPSDAYQESPILAGSWDPAVESAIAIDQDGPTLEGRLGSPATDGPAGGLVLCHPHPQYGGDMENPVVRAAEVARQRGLLTLRFNFRGVGGSAGSYDQGRGELSDAMAAVAEAQGRLCPGQPIGILGYSFGAWVAARLATAGGASLAALCLVAPPLTMLDFGAVDAAELRVLIAAGTRDPYCPMEMLRPWLARLPGVETAIIEGADHFFFGKLYPLGAAVGDWTTRWAAPGSGSDAGEARRSRGAG